MVLIRHEERLIPSALKTRSGGNIITQTELHQNDVDAVQLIAEDMRIWMMVEIAQGILKTVHPCVHGVVASKSGSVNELEFSIKTERLICRQTYRRSFL